jgi:group I intron endonuclease
MINTGIYRIVNLINNHCYIGSTNNFSIRKRAHANLFFKGKHFNPKLQAAYNKYGNNNLVFEVIITCPQELLFWYEQQFLDEWKPEYNISKNAQVPTKRGEHLSTEHCANISKGLLGKTRTEESKRKQSMSRMGITYSDETKKLWSKQRTGHERTAKLHKGLVAPDGTIYRNIFNMAKFCREHDLKRSKVWNIERGKSEHHYGWTLYKEGI